MGVCMVQGDRGWKGRGCVGPMGISGWCRWIWQVQRGKGVDVGFGSVIGVQVDR